MATFDHKIFLWNRDHNFKDYKNKEMSITELSEFLGCELVSEEEKIKINENNLLVPTKTLTITKNGYLIVAKDKDGKIIIEDLDELEIEPTSIKEINFGWKIDKSFKYTAEELQWAQDLQESAQALRVVGNPKKVEPSDKLNPQEFAESFIEDSYMASSNVNDCYWAKLSSFSGWSNGSNKLLEFLSWPNKTTVQLAPKRFFVSENKSDWGTHYDTHGIMNWGTNGPSLIGIACGEAEVGTFEHNIFTYENKEYLLPSDGQIVRVSRSPANDLYLSGDLTYVLSQMALEPTKRRDPQLFYGKIPTLMYWVPHSENNALHFAKVSASNGADEGYSVRLSTEACTWYPWIERSSNTEDYTYIQDGYQYYRDATAYPFLDEFYSYGTLSEYTGTTDGYYMSFNYWYNKFFRSSFEWQPQNWDLQRSYSAYITCPSTQFVLLKDIVKDDDGQIIIDANNIVTIQNPTNHLLIKNTNYTYPITVSNSIDEDTVEHSDRVTFLFNSFKKYYRTRNEWKSMGNTKFAITIRLSNFCLYPGEQLTDLITFTPELQTYEGRTWHVNKNDDNKDKHNPQNAFLGLAIKMFWKPRLINTNTSEFLNPQDCHGQPKISVEVDGRSATVEKFQRWGCWDLLTHRITSLSSLLLFNDEKTVEGKTNYFSFRDSNYKTQDDKPIFLWSKRISDADLPENNNFSSLDAPLFYWPSMSDKTNILAFDWDGSDETAAYGQTTNWGYIMLSHSSFSSSQQCGYRLTGTDHGAVAFFVEPDATKPNFNVSSVYGWYWTDNSIHINVKYDEEQNEVLFQLVNYSLSTLDAQIEAIEIQVPSLSACDWEHIYEDETLSINQKLVFNKIDDPMNYTGLWKIKSNNQVYRDNTLYGEWTEEGIKPYNLTKGEN